MTTKTGTGGSRHVGIEATDGESSGEDIFWSSQQIRALNEIAQVANRSFKVNELLNFAADKLAEILPADKIIIRLLEDDGQTLRLVVLRGMPPGYEMAQPTRRIGMGMVGMVALTSRPAMIRDVRKRHKLTYNIKFDTRSLMAVPLMSEGRVVGVMVTASKMPNVFSSGDLLLLSSVGHHLGTAIDKCSRSGRLQSSEERYRYLFENAAEPIFVTDARGHISEANLAACSFSGYSKDELSAKRLDDLLSVPSKTSGDPTSLSDDTRNLSFCTKDGHEAIVRCLNRPVFRDSQLVGAQTIIRGLTNQRWTQQTFGDYLRQVTLAQENERKRIARDLHDDTIQSMVIVSHRLRRFSSRYEGHLEKEAIGDLQETINLLVQSVENLRELTISLRPSILDDVGLVPSLRWLAQGLRQAASIDCDVEITGNQRPLSPETELALFRIVQEALNNVRRHSGATHARIRLAFSQGHGRLTIQDNGHGFEAPRSLASLGALGKLGLAGMKQRAAQIGAAFSIESKRGEGTTISVNF